MSTGILTPGGMSSSHGQTTPSRILSWVDSIPLEPLRYTHRREQYGAEPSSRNTLDDDNLPEGQAFAADESALQPEEIALPDSRRSSGAIEYAATDMDPFANLYQSLPNEHLGPPPASESDIALPDLRRSSEAMGPMTAGMRTISDLDHTLSNEHSGRPPAFETDSSGQSPVRSYWDQVTPLALCLPQLRVLPLNLPSRWPGIGKVLCIDYPKGYTLPRKYKTWSCDRSSEQKLDWSEKIPKLRREILPHPSTRAILVEDLSKELMEALGSTFHLDPEYFAAHLARSSHCKCDHQEKLPHAVAISGSMPTYVSLNWLRPVKQLPKLSEWLETAEMLLDEREIEARYGRYGGRTSTERGISWMDTARKTLHRVTPDTNTWRRSWSLSTTRPVQMGGDLSKYASTMDWDTQAVPTVWEERATLCVYREGSANTVLMLLDPLPSVTEETTSVAEHFKPGEERSPIFDSQTRVKCFSPLTPRHRLWLPPNKLDVSPFDVSILQNSMNSVPSTRRAIRQWTFERGPIAMNQPYEPWLSLLEVVYADTKGFIRIFTAVLDKISRDSLNDYLMERMLTDWRRMMIDFQTELPTIRTSLFNFAQVMFGEHPTVPSLGLENCAALDSTRATVAELDEELAGLQAKINDTYAALRVDMQFSESRRSINEAKTVAKLTELAFIFVPLAFVSSLFSMSVNELKNGVPIWNFVVTALVVAVLAYGFRFAIAHEYLADCSQRAREGYWARSDVTTGASVPPLTFVSLVSREIWSHGGKRLLFHCSRIAFLSALIILPVCFLWVSTGLNSGLKLSLSLVLLFSGFGFALFPKILNNLDTDSFGPNHLVGLWRRRKSPSSRQEV